MAGPAGIARLTSDEMPSPRRKDPLIARLDAVNTMSARMVAWPTVRHRPRKSHPPTSLRPAGQQPRWRDLPATPPRAGPVPNRNGRSRNHCRQRPTAPPHPQNAPTQSRKWIRARKNRGAAAGASPYRPESNVFTPCSGFRQKIPWHARQEPHLRRRDRTVEKPAPRHPDLRPAK